MNADGSNQRRWSLSRYSEHGTGWHPTLPIVVYHNHAGLSDVDGNGDIVSTRRSTSQDGHVGDEHPTWFTDGSKILFNSARDGDLDLYTVNADGSNIRSLTSNDALDCCAKHR